MGKEIGIYIFENIINGKMYVGKSIDLKNRMRNRHQASTILNREIEKYGWENFKRYVIWRCETDESLDDLETYFIESLHTHCSEGGLNVSWGGGSTMKGLKHSEETKLKMSNSAKEYLASDRNTRPAISPSLGKHYSQEMKDNVRKAHAGKKQKNRIKSPASKYMNVSKEDYRNTGKIIWKTSIKVNRKSIFIASYQKTEEDAAIIRDVFVYARKMGFQLNFPELENRYNKFLRENGFNENIENTQLRLLCKKFLKEFRDGN